MKNELYHHGILGQKWGIRRYQNDDGTLTEAGKRRYQSGNFRKDYQNRLNDLDTAIARNKKDAIKALEKHDRLTALKDKSLKERIKSGLIYDTPISKKRIQESKDNYWKRVEVYSKMVELGERETNNILRNMSKQDMGLHSKKVIKASLDGKEYYDVVKGSVGEGNKDYVLTKRTYESGDTPWHGDLYITDVMGTKYKVSNRPHGKYKSLRGD